MTRLAASSNAGHDNLLRLSAALVIQRGARNCENPARLRDFMVNESARVHGHDIGVFLARKGRTLKLEASSNVSAVERGGPLAQWMETVCLRLTRGHDGTVLRITPADLSETERAEMPANLPDQWLLIPLRRPGGADFGVLVLLRQSPWRDADLKLADTMGDCYAHAIAALGGRRRLGRPRLAHYGAAALLAALILALAFVRVPLTVVAPAEVVPKDPTIVTAPFNGVIADVEVEPYQQVRAGDLLLSFDRTQLAMERDLAARALDVARAELDRFRDLSFTDDDSKPKIKIWESKVRLRAMALAHAEEKLAKSRVHAEHAGVVRFSDRFNLEGKPVTTGQGLLEIARPADAWLEIRVPPRALIPLPESAQVTFFLDVAPATPHHATLVRKGYDAQALENQQLSYRFFAQPAESARGLILGAHGTARIYGAPVRLGYFILRRPLAAARRWLGL